MSTIQHDAITAEHPTWDGSEAGPDLEPGEVPVVPEVRTGPSRCDFRRFTVEPLAFIYFFAALATIPLTAQLLYRNVAVRMNVTDVIEQDESTCSVNTSDPIYVTQQEVQAVSSEWLMYLEVVNTVPAMLTTLFLGAYSDRCGRKPAMLLPLAGGLIRSVISAVILLARLPNVLLLLGYAIDGASGGICSLAMACFSYVADTTSRRERVMRILMLEVTITLAQTLANITIGYLIPAVGFTYCYVIIMAAYVIAFLYAILVVKETVVKQENVSIFTLDHFKPVARLFFVSDGTSRRWILQLILVIIGITFIGEVGSNDSLTLYLLGAPICYNSVKIGYFIGVSSFVRSVGSVSFAHLLDRYLKEVAVVFISCISAAVFYLWLGLATSGILLFLAPLGGICSTLVVPFSRTIASKIVQPHEQGAVFSGISLTQLSGMLIGYLGINNLYRVTLDLAKGAFVFYLVAALYCLNAALTILLKHLMDKKRGSTPPSSPAVLA